MNAARRVFRLAMLFAIVSRESHAAEPKSLRREVFPIPSVIAGIFRTGGLAAFDPFHAWEKGTGRPHTFLAPASLGADAARLPQGRCYDVLPAWTTRGFRPHHGTRVLYHPESQLIFASIAPQDEKQVRAFCDWPPALWLGESSWDDSGGGSRQTQFRVTAWVVPATAAGGWKFRPEKPADLMALPAGVRRMAGRHDFVVRSGQRSRADSLTAPAAAQDESGIGMSTELECIFAEDDVTVDFNLAVTIQTKPGSATVARLQANFQRVTARGDAWLVEAGILPGNPPERLFLVCKSAPVQLDDRWNSLWLETTVERWTGRAPLRMDAGGMTGGVFNQDSFQEEVDLSKEPAPRDPSIDDPFEAPDGTRWRVVPQFVGDAAEKLWPQKVVPEPFGDVPVQDITPFVEKFCALTPDAIQAWRNQRDGLIYVKGTEAALEAIARQLEPLNHDPASNTVIAELTLETVNPRDEGDQSIIWHSRLPVRPWDRRFQIRPDERSGVKLHYLSTSANGDNVEAAWCDIELRAIHHAPPAGSGADQTSRWELTAAVALNPPLVAAPIALPELQENGGPNGAILRRVVGKSRDGKELVLTVRLHPSPFKTSRLWRPPPRLLWWWQQRVTRAADR